MFTARASTVLLSVFVGIATVNGASAHAAMCGTGRQDTPQAGEKKTDPPDSAMQVRPIPIKHRSVTDLAKQIEKSLRGRLAANVSVTADVHTNSIIAQGTEEGIAAVEKMIADLDRPAAGAAAVADSRGTSLRITSYRVNVPQARAMQIKADELAKTAADDAQLRGVLEKLGATRLLYCCDQEVELSDKPAIKLGSQVPFATGATKSKDGAAKSTSISYQEQGMMIQVSGGWRAEQAEQGVAQIRFEISDALPTDLDVGMETPPPVIQSIKQQFSGPFASGRPIVLLALGTTSMKDSAIVYVTRIEIRRISEPAKP